MITVVISRLYTCSSKCSPLIHTVATSGLSGLKLVSTGYMIHDFLCNTLELVLCGPFTKYFPPRPPGFLGARDAELATLHSQVENSCGQEVWWVTQA
jgi:hypothetical protein